MKKSPLISVIIPVYNAEGYLNKCLDSVMNQTYKNVQIILINDGSTDGSVDICEEYLIKDDRFTIFHQKNLKNSAARNRGVLHARGEYICFIDADDFVEKNMIELLYNKCIEDKVQIATCSFNFYFSENEIIPHTRLHVDFAQKSDDIDYGRLLSDHHYIAPWGKLYHKDLIKDIKFPLDVYHEDIGYWFAVLAKLKNISSIDDNLYYYRKDKADAITMNKKLNYRRKTDTLKSFKYGVEQVMQSNPSEAFKLALLKLFFHFFAEPTAELYDDQMYIINSLFTKIESLNIDEQNSLKTYQNGFKWLHKEKSLFRINLFPKLRKKIIGFSFYIGGLLEIRFCIGKAKK